MEGEVGGEAKRGRGERQQDEPLPWRARRQLEHSHQPGGSAKAGDHGEAAETKLEEEQRDDESRQEGREPRLKERFANDGGLVG
jgi:hypothetical protein